MHKLRDIMHGPERDAWTWSHPDPHGRSRRVPTPQKLHCNRAFERNPGWEVYKTLNRGLFGLLPNSKCSMKTFWLTIKKGRAVLVTAPDDFRWASDPAAHNSGAPAKMGTQSSWRYYLLQRDKLKCLQWASGWERVGGGRGAWMKTLSRRLRVVMPESEVTSSQIDR